MLNLKCKIINFLNRKTEICRKESNNFKNKKKNLKFKIKCIN